MPTYHIITIGCQMNKSDSERIASHLESLGFTLINNKFKADLAVVVTCGVRQAAEDRIYGLIPRIKKVNPKTEIILTGCLVGREDVKKRLGKYIDEWLSVKEISKLQFPRASSSGGRLISNKIFNVQCQVPKGIGNFELDDGGYLKINPKYTSKVSAFVPIGNGCNNFCSYCVVPYARGREVYRPADEIVSEVKNLVNQGYKEIVLIAQNVNSFKSRISYRVSRIAYCQGRNYINFSELLQIINDIPGDFWVRFVTSHPKDMSGELINTIRQCDKVCQHIHLPVQSGDNGILKAMNRKYTISHYKNLVKQIRKQIAMKTERMATNNFKNRREIWQPPVAITTDVIVGFPGETGRQFNNIKKLFKEIKFDMAYIAQYSPRPGTAAEKLTDNVSPEEKKKRENDLNKLLRQIALDNNKEYLGKIVKVLVESKNKKGEYFGKTETDKNTRIIGQKFNKNLIGKFVVVKINKVRDFGLEGIVANKKYEN